MTSTISAESPSTKAMPKREQKARLRAYRALKKEMKEGLRDTYDQLLVQLDQLVKTKQDSGKLPWKDVAQAMSDNNEDALAQHRDLVKQVRRQESFVQVLHRYVLSHSLPSQIRTPLDNPMQPSSWRHTTMTRHPDARHHGMRWMVEHMQCNHERLFQLYGFSHGSSTTTELLNQCTFTYKDGFQSMVRQAEFIVHASLSEISSRMGDDFMKFWYENTTEHFVIATTRVDQAAPGVFLNETLQGYAVSAKVRLDATRLLCFVQAVTDEDEGEWPAHRVSQPHNRVSLVLLHQLSPTTTKLQSLYLFQSAIPEPVDGLLEDVGLTAKAAALLAERQPDNRNSQSAKEYCVDDLKSRLYNQHMSTSGETNVLVYRSRWRNVLDGIPFLN